MMKKISHGWKSSSFKKKSLLLKKSHFQKSPIVCKISLTSIKIQFYLFYPQKFEFKSRYARALRLNLRFNLVWINVDFCPSVLFPRLTNIIKKNLRVMGSVTI